MSISQEELNDAYNRFRSRYEGKKEDYFAPLYIAKKHGITLDTAFEYSLRGHNGAKV